MLTEEQMKSFQEEMQTIDKMFEKDAKLSDISGDTETRLRIQVAAKYGLI